MSLTSSRLSQLLILSATLLPLPSSADIFQWEYIDPSDPSKGKQSTTILCTDGEGTDPRPGANW